MSTRYVYRMTARCPEALISDANQLAGVIGECMEDVNTYGAARYEDTEGRLFSVASFQATEGLFEKVGGPLQRPEYDTEDEIDLTAAGRAQARLVLIYPPTEEEPDAPEFGPDNLVVFIDYSPSEALQIAGLNLIATEDDEA